MKTIYTILAVLFVLITAFVTNKESAFITDLKKQVQAYLKESNEEKVYVQTDKTLYMPGEYIWFNAFLTDAATGKPSTISNIVYVDIYDPKGNLFKQLKLHAKDGMAGGEILLEESRPGGLYKLKAYTTWMKNFGEDRYFTKELQVQKAITPRLLLKPDFEKKAYGAGDEVIATLSVTDLENRKANLATVKVKVDLDGTLYKEFTVQTDKEGHAEMKFQLPAQLNSADGLLQAIVSFQGVEESVSRSIPIVLNKLNLTFYPEGGNWIGGINSRMAFEAINEFGKGADVSGEILDQQGKKVGSFESFHFGMGSFEMNPEPGKKYSARILKPAGTDSLFALPVAEIKTFGLNLKKQSQTSVSWAIYAPDRISGALITQVNGIIYDQQEINLKKGLNEVTCNTQQLPAGVAVFTLFDGSGTPVCERLVMVNADKKMNIAIKTDKEKYTPGEKIKAEITTTDAKGNPIAANLSLAVVDEQLLTMADDKQDNILSYLLLTSDLKGKIYEPSFYFDPTKEKSEKAIDYLLLTHGWRRFTWNDVLHPAKKDRIAPENIGNYYGRVEDKNQKPVKADVILMELNNKKRILQVKTSDDGQFAFLNVDPAASVVLFTSVPNKVVLTGKIMDDSSQDSLTKASPGVVDLSGMNEGDIFLTIPYTNAKKLYTFLEETMRRRNPYPIIVEDEMMQNNFDMAFRDEAVEENMVVVAMGMRRVQKQQAVAAVVAVAPQEILDNPVKDLKEQKVVARVGDFFIGEGRADKQMVQIQEIIRGPLFVIDGMYMPYPGNNASDMGVFNYTKTSFIGVTRDKEAISYFGHQAANGVIMINTVQDWEDPKTAEKPAYSSSFHSGVTSINASRSYYELAPRKEPVEGVRSDFRTTVYWNNTVHTDKSGKAEVEFYNNEMVSAFRITAEGITSTGLAGRVEHTYTSQLPLSLDAKLPNYLSFGDTLQIPVSIRNNTDAMLQPEVRLNITSGLRVLGASQARPSIQPETSEKVLFTVVSTGDAGVHPIEIQLTEGKFKDAIKQNLNIYPIGFPRSFSVSGREENRSVEFDINDLEPGSLQGTTTLHISIMDELFAGMESILREPYGCFEQVSSITFPNIFVMQLMQATGQANDATMAKAMGYIKNGYNKLTSYEISTGGFEWFGNPPANEALTAYGLVEFHEMNKIFDGVDPKMVDRTKAYLLGRRNPDGTFIQNRGRFDVLSSAPYSVNCAYVVYALSETGVSDFDISYAHSLKEVEASKDMYRMALMSLAARNLGKEGDCTRLTNHFLAFVRSKTPFDQLKIESTIVSSNGRTSAVEAVSLWAVSLLREKNQDWEAIEQCIQFIVSNRGGYGYGSTQATSLALKALTDYALKSKSNRKDGVMTLKMNDGTTYPLAYTKESRGSIINNEFAGNLKQGKNKISVQFDKPESVQPYSVVIRWNAGTPESAAGCPLELTTTLSQKRIKQNETVRLTIKLKNKDTKKGQPMSMAVIGIPAGLTPQPWQLKELQEKGVFDYYEILDNRLAIYYRALDIADTKSIGIDLKADIPGKYIGAASSGYLYYQQEERHWLKGLEITIDGE